MLQVEGEASAKRKFKAYPIGYFHIDVEKVARRTAGDFLRRLIAAVPYRVHTALTDDVTN